MTPRDAEEHARAVGTESETGATAGSTHEDVLVRQLGWERGLAVAIKDGPPAVRK